jgi:hypothetical protein
LRKVLEEWSKITARCVGASEPRSSATIFQTMLQKPATAPIGMPSDLRVSGGSA